MWRACVPLDWMFLWTRGPRTNFPSIRTGCPSPAFQRTNTASFPDPHLAFLYCKWQEAGSGNEAHIIWCNNALRTSMCVSAKVKFLLKSNQLLMHTVCDRRLGLLFKWVWFWVLSSSIKVVYTYQCQWRSCNTLLVSSRQFCALPSDEERQQLLSMWEVCHFEGSVLTSLACNIHCLHGSSSQLLQAREVSFPTSLPANTNLRPNPAHYRAPSEWA